MVDDYLSFEEVRGVLIRGNAQLISEGKLHEIGRDLIYKKYPKYKEAFPIEEDGPNKYILVITPSKVSSWGIEKGK